MTVAEFFTAGVVWLGITLIAVGLILWLATRDEREDEGEPGELIHVNFGDRGRAA